MNIYNPPSDPFLRDSLEAIISESLPDKSEDASLYLVRDCDEIGYLNTVLQDIVRSNQDVIINTLSLGVAIQLRGLRETLKQKDINLVSDYTNPTNAPDKKEVSFFSSEVCRPLIDHVYNQLSKSLNPSIKHYQATVTRIGSDLLPDFPCKLDVDILVCIPSRENFEMFVRELSKSVIFIQPQQKISDNHTFFYAQLLGSPIDLHVYNSSMEDCPLYKRVQMLARDKELQQQYRLFKQSYVGESIANYRQAKEKFRQEHGWF